MADIIRLEGMRFFGHHGARKEEQALGQPFEVDVEVEADLSRALVSDKLADTINYSVVYALVREVMEGPSRNLIEKLADECGQRILARFATVEAVTVWVCKLNVPIAGVITGGATVEVRLVRE